MTIWQRWKQTAIHNIALVLTSLLVAFGTLFYAGAAAFQLWMMNQSGKHTDEQIGRVIGNVNWMARSMDQSAKDISAQMQSQSAAMQKSAKAMESFAKSSKIAAQTADKQREALQRQNDLIVQQASAELVFQNYTVTQQPATNEQPATRVVSFDLVNVGGSAATQISEESGGDIYHLPDEAKQATAGVAQIDPAGFPLDKGQSKTIKIDTEIWKVIRNRPSNAAESYTWRRYTYLTIFHKAETVCVLIIGTKGGPRRLPCVAVKPKQP